MFLDAGHRPVSDIDREHACKRPGLEMLHLDLRVEPDTVPGRAEPPPQLDVLDTRPAKALVEPTDRLERSPADCPATRPERGDFPSRTLVHVMMQQVPVPRHPPGRGRLRIIRTKHAGELFVTGQKLLDLP